MWSPVFLLLLVGATIANQQNGWKNGQEYIYKVRSRTLASYNQESKQFTGILIEAKLIVQPNGADNLRAKILSPRYSQIHTRLDQGWDSEIPADRLSLQTLPLSTGSFEIKMKNGVVRDLIVDKDVSTWEVNVLKSIVSQLQVDTQGENAENSEHNHLPEKNQPTGTYKVMEDSVGGTCQVIYDISTLPQRALQNNPEWVPMPELREEHGDIIALVKTKNYSNCDQRVSYHFGINGRNRWEPGSNENGRYLARSSVSQIIISGNLKRYTIQSSVTTNKVVLNPDQEDSQQGMVASRMNLTLHEVKDKSDQISAPSNPQSTGNLVYNYNNPFESSSSRRPNRYNKKNKLHKHKEQRNRFSGDSDSSEESSENSDNEYENDENSYLQPRPKLNEPPFNPMLPFFIGNHGNSILKNNKVDSVKTAKSIAQQIGNELQKPGKMSEEQTLEKFSILASLIRLMNAEQIADVQRELYEQPRSSNQLKQSNEAQNARRAAWVAYRDAVAQAGTGPALVNIKKWVQSKQIEGLEAANVISTIAKAARTPTKEYMDEYFNLVTMQETKKHSSVRNAAILSFADLIRHSIVNKESAHNRYPVHVFGKLNPEGKKRAHEKYIPYMADELQAAVDAGDSPKIQAYITALERTAHPQILAVFEPYLEGKKQVSSFQRLLMVQAMRKLTSSHPKLARSVLYKIYSNNAEENEIRVAAVYLLMKTNPPASMLQRMADFTNSDTSKQVNSAVKSTIESLSQLEGNEANELANAAKSALPLLTPEIYGLQYSKHSMYNSRNPDTHSGYSMKANYIGSENSVVPSSAYFTLSPVYEGLKVPKIQLLAQISDPQNLMTFIQEQLSKKAKDNKDNKEATQDHSPENLAKLLGIHGEDPEQVEGRIFMTQKNNDFFYAFDNHTIENIEHQLKEMSKSMENGMDFEQTKFNSYEVAMSFPTETGLPLTFTLKSPTVTSIQGEISLRSQADSNSHVPKSASVNGKVRVVYAMKVQKRLGFVTPFEHQQYVAGVDKNMQFFVPVRAEVEANKNKKEARLKLQANEDEGNFKVLQFKTQPFTSKHDILSLQPISNDKSTLVINKDRAMSHQLEINDENNKHSMEFQWKKQNSRSNEENESRQEKREKAMEAARSLARSIATLYYPQSSEQTEYEKYSIKMTPSSDLSAELTVSYDSMTTESKSSDDNEDSSSSNSESNRNRSNNSNNNDNRSSSSPNAKAPHLEKSLNQLERKQKLLREASQSINSARANAVDIDLKVNSGSQTTYAFTAAVAKSHVDKKSRLLVYASAKSKEGKDYHLAAAVEGKTPNTDLLDFEETLKANTEREFDAIVHYGKGLEEGGDENRSKIKIQGSVKQTEERKNEIRRSREAQLCTSQQNQHNNKMSSHCQKVNQRAASIDKGYFKATFENEKAAKEWVMNALDRVEKMAQNYVSVEKDRHEKEDKNEMKMHFEMSQQHDQVDITFKTPEGKIKFNEVQLRTSRKEPSGKGADWNNEQDAREILMLQSTCNLDKTEVKTFDNQRYNMREGQCWHVAMTAFPKNDPDRPSQQQEIPKGMHATVMTRESEDGWKELKITLGEKVVDLFAKESRKLQAMVNGEKIKTHKHRSFQHTNGEEMLFEIFELPDDSLKVVSDKYGVDITYDGYRAQIKAAPRYLDSVRGLCGNNDGEPSNDQQTPKGCTLQNPEEFAASYALVNDEHCKSNARQIQERSRQSECSYEDIRPGNVVSDREAGRESSQRGQSDSWHQSSNEDEKGSCLQHRTKVIRGQVEICFSLRTVPTCSSKCIAASTKTKAIQFHCVERTEASEKVASRVEKGVNPDLSQKTVTKTEHYNIPISCKAA